MAKFITVTEIVRSFSDIIGRVYYKGESFEIKKGNNVVARLLPAKGRATITIAELGELFKSAPHLAANDAAEFEADVQEIRARRGREVNKWQ